MPETILQPEDPLGLGNGASGGSASPMPFAAPPGGLTSTASGAASALAGWTMSALSKQFDSSNLASTPMDASIRTGSSSTTASSSTTTSGNSPWPEVTRPYSVPARSAASPVSPSTDGASTPAWGAMGEDLMDVNDDKDDWSSFETGIKTSQVAKKKVPGGGLRSKPIKPAAVTRLSTTAARPPPAGVAPAPQRASLKVADAAADDGAWGESWEAPAAAAPLSTSSSAVPSRSSTPSGATATAAAFEAPVPASWEAPAAAAPVLTETWGTIDDADQEEEEDKKPAASGSPALASAMSKEEKRAEMERQRQERRAVSRVNFVCWCYADRLVPHSAWRRSRSHELQNWGRG